MQSEGEVSRTSGKDGGVLLPLNADKSVWGQAAQPLWAFGAVTGQQKSLRAFVEFVGAPATEALDRRYFNRAVQALGLPHGPWVDWFG